jgi:hypothetical protein
MQRLRGRNLRRQTLRALPRLGLGVRPALGRWQPGPNNPASWSSDSRGFGVEVGYWGSGRAVGAALATNLEQVRVCSRADQVQVVAIDFVEQEPTRFDVAVPDDVSSFR